MTVVRRPLSAVLALLLLTSVLAVFQSTTAPPPAGAAPAPVMEMPACPEDAKRYDAGDCGRVGTYGTISMTGRLGEGLAADVSVSANVAPCGDIPYGTVPSSPCYTGVGWYSGNRCTSYHLASKWLSDDYICQTQLYSPGGPSPSTNQSLEFNGDLNDNFGGSQFTNLCGGRGNYGTYVAGGPSGATWAQRASRYLACQFTWRGAEPDWMPGPTWVRIEARLELAGVPGSPLGTSERLFVWVPLDGEMRNLGPQVRFEPTSAGGLSVDFDNTTFHHDDLAMTYEWNFGEGAGYTSTEHSPSHEYAEAGTYTVRLKATDSEGVTRYGNKQVEVQPRQLTGEWFRTDPVSEGVKKGEVAPVRLRVDNETGDQLTDVELVSATVAGSGEVPGVATLTKLSAPREGDTVVHELPGELADSGPGSVGFVDYDLEGVEPGDVTLTAVVRAVGPDGDIVEGTIEEDWVVRATDLTIDITFDPEDRVQTESDDPETDPEPVEMTATVTMTNTSGGKLSRITVEEFEVTRAIGEQQLWLEQVGGQRLTNWEAPGILLEAPVLTDEPLQPFDLEAGEDEVFTADFIVRDDGQLDFHVLALAADAADRTVRGYGEASWVLTPEKYLEVTTEVIIPQQGDLLKAGEVIYIKGRVVNLSQTASLEVGPLIPVPSGNTGQLSLAYGGGRAPDPTELPGVPPPLELGPGDSELFEVGIATGYSDPRTNFDTGEPEAAPTGGTRAYFEFDPWAIATEADGTVRTVRTDPQDEEDRGVKLAEEHRNLKVSIDDSIAIPELDYVALAGGIGVGLVTGIAHAGVGLIVGVVETIKLPYTLTVGAMEYQSRVWNSFTDEEKLLYTQDLSTYLFAMAVGNVENGLKDAEQLKGDINDMVFREMTRLADEWETGDYVSTAEAYAAGGSEIAASLWMPAAMTKLAQTPRAAAALERAQLAVNARMGPVFAEARTLRYVEDALPLLQALENGAEISADVMRQLYGVTPDEVAELQRLAQKYKLLITFRSRHPSSVVWMEKFGAMLKPEAIKIKTVSEMDVALGYRSGDLGSVVFRKPDVLKGAPPDEGVAFLDHVRGFVQSKGFTPGTADYDSAVDRMKLRVKEWYKHEAEYKAYDRRKSIPTEFNYEGNAIRIAAPDNHNRRTGFKLDKVGDEEYVVRLLDPKTGKYKRVTGDIDPISFTNLDGSPLTTVQHRDVINEMRASAKLEAQHPESVTFTGYVGGKQVVKPGLDFIEDQFKPGEAAAQLGPDGPARAVRLDKGKSRWDSVRDYNLHWEGGYKHVGGRGKIEQRTDFDPDFGRRTDVEVPDEFEFTTVQLGEIGEAGIGRATLQAVKTGAGTAVFVGEGGQLVEVNPDGSTQPWEGGAGILEEGEPVTLQIAPAGEVESTVTSNVQGAALPDGQFFRQQFSVAATAPQVDGVVLVDDGAPVLFDPGQVVAVGVQDGQGELRTIASVDGRELRFTEPVAAAAEDIVVMVQPAPGASGGGGSVGTVTGPGTPDGTQSLDPACPTGVPAPGFADLGATHARAVGCASHWALVEGYDATTFGPGDTLTRGQLFTVLTRLLAHLDVEVPTSVPDAFADDDGTTHEPAADLLAALGLAGGFADGTVGLATPVTRAQVAALLARVAGLAGDELPDGLGRFGDLAGSVHRDAIERLAAAGIVAGYDETRFGPTDRLTRGQTATIVMRYLARLVDLDRAARPVYATGG